MGWLPTGGGGSGFTYSGANVKRTSSNQSITGGSETAIAFNGEDWDIGSYHDNATNNTRITVPTTDKYLVTGFVTLLNLDSVDVFSRLRIDGSAGDLGWLARKGDGVSGTYAFSFAVQLSLSANSYIEVMVFQASGAFDVQADRTRVQIVKLG